MKSAFRWFHNLLEHPVKVAALAVILAFSSLLAGGTFLDLWNLTREKAKIKKHLEQITRDNAELSQKIKQAKNNDKFIGRQARATLDLVKQDELIFVFENDDLFESTPHDHH